jgi:hypothetical protein
MTKKRHLLTLSLASPALRAGLAGSIFLSLFFAFGARSIARPGHKE